MANHRAAQATVNRTHLKDANEIDGKITKDTVNRLAPLEKKIYSHISSGGAWAEGHLENIGVSQGMCTHCGKKAEDITHVCWKCPVVNSHRQIDDLSNINPDLLPDYIKHGVPKAMSIDIEASFWGDKCEGAEIDSNRETLQAIGLQTNNQRKIIASCKNQQIKDTCKDKNIQPDNLNARQCFQQIKTNKPPPPSCHSVQVPSSPTDGHQCLH